MDVDIFAKILKDANFTDYRKMKYKYGEDFDVALTELEKHFYKSLPIRDFDGKNAVFIDNYTSVTQNTVKLLLMTQTDRYGIKAAENEIISTSAIENIDFSRDSVRRILKGFAPADSEEDRIAGIRHGFDFISDTSNKITEENLCKLYNMTIGEFLPGDDRLPSGCRYRNGEVYVVGNRIEHTGLDCKKVPEYMKALIDFANADDDINDLIKAAVIHFYFAYVHPYFDGNGRTARMLHLWFLIQRGYRSALFIPFSSCIEKSRKAYYDAFTSVEENKRYSGKTDVTPFILYFVNNVYNKMTNLYADTNVLADYENAVKDGKITEKETVLWKFVLSNYGTAEFSTKRLEKDFGNVAYATVRGFVLKFTAMGLLASAKYGTRTKYRIAK